MRSLECLYGASSVLSWSTSCTLILWYSYPCLRPICKCLLLLLLLLLTAVLVVLAKYEKTGFVWKMCSRFRNKKCVIVSFKTYKSFKSKKKFDSIFVINWNDFKIVPVLMKIVKSFLKNCCLKSHQPNLYILNSPKISNLWCKITF